MRNLFSGCSRIKVIKQKSTLNSPERRFLMTYSTTNTYQMKRDILTFSKIISSKSHKSDRKFAADMIYGILASGSCRLTDIVDQLHENTKKVNAVERLAKHLNKGIPKDQLSAYLKTVKTMAPSNPVIHIDDSDVVKPDGYKFENLGYVRDGSKSSAAKTVYSKGYHVTEACVLTKSNHPVSIFSKVHSSTEKSFTSINDITFHAMEWGAKLFNKATFVMDRGYDDNKMFLKLDELNQDYVIRLTRKRKVFYKGKFIPVTELCNRRKGKVHIKLFHKGRQQDAYISHIKVQITASKKNVYVVLIYGITEHPMMLVTNKDIQSREDIVNVAKVYFSRWKIEEYFRCKKQQFRFEDFRVRKLKAINALNFYITAAMAYLARITLKRETNGIKYAVINAADPIKGKVAFHYYRISKGIFRLLSYATEGIRLWFKTKRPKYRQLCFRLIT